MLGAIASEIFEAKRQQLAHAIDGIDRVAPHKKHAYWLWGVFFKLQQSLAAHSTRRAWFFHKVALGEGCHSYCRDGHAWIVGTGIVTCAALGTDACKRRILLISSHDGDTVLQHDGRTHVEMAVGRVAVSGGKLCHIDQFFVVANKFTVGVNLYLCNNVFFSHG